MSRLGPRAFLLSLALALLSGCGSPTHTAAPAQQSTATLVCSSSGEASPTWPAPSTRTESTPPIVSATVAEDTFTVAFDRGTPAFELTRQTNTHFNADSGLGQPIDVAGSAGVRIVLRGFRGDVNNYSGPTSFTSQGPLLLQVRSLGGSEGQASFAAGLSRPGCASVTTTASTLKFQFIPSS
jgi:hypothetical protein